jgi:transcriptional regulator with XRE-family HTH domain
MKIGDFIIVKDKRIKENGQIAHVESVALTHIEKGRNNINAVQLWKLACIFGCEPSDFFPPIPKGFALTNFDYQKIAREDEKAEGWARELFSDEF